MEDVDDLVGLADIDATSGMPGIGTVDMAAAQLIQSPGPLLAAPAAPEIEVDISRIWSRRPGRSKLTAAMIGAKTRTAFGSLPVRNTREEIEWKQSSTLSAVGQDITIFVGPAKFRRSAK